MQNFEQSIGYRKNGDTIILINDRRYGNDVECILNEIKYTDDLQSRVDYANEHIFKNFKLHLVMDCEDEKENLD